MNRVGQAPHVHRPEVAECVRRRAVLRLRLEKRHRLVQLALARQGCGVGTEEDASEEEQWQQRGLGCGAVSVPMASALKFRELSASAPFFFARFRFLRDCTPRASSRTATATKRRHRAIGLRNL